jgi:hypothetical protein
MRAIRMTTASTSVLPSGICILGGQVVGHYIEQRIPAELEVAVNDTRRIAMPDQKVVVSSCAWPVSAER